jgi:hypothetical protein
MSSLRSAEHDDDDYHNEEATVSDVKYPILGGTTIRTNTGTISSLITTHITTITTRSTPTNVSTTIHGNDNNGTVHYRLGLSTQYHHHHYHHHYHNYYPKYDILILGTTQYQITNLGSMEGIDKWESRGYRQESSHDTGW